METRKPQTELEWQELLSAYIDGELEAGERRAVEAWLAEHPERAAQLRDLQSLGGLLQEWTVEAPEPDPAFLRRIEVAQASSLHPSAVQAGSLRHEGGWRELLRRALWIPWPVAAAVFIAGMLSGAAGLQLLQNRNVVARASSPVTQPMGEDARAMAAPVISVAQADTLRRELQAADLRDRLLRELQRRDYDSAARLYRNLWDNYRDSSAVRQLRQNPALRAAAQRLAPSGRI